MTLVGSGKYPDYSVIGLLSITEIRHIFVIVSNYCAIVHNQKSHIKLQTSKHIKNIYDNCAIKAAQCLLITSLVFKKKNMSNN